MTKLKGLLLTEGMHGMISQVEGLAKSLDIDLKLRGLYDVKIDPKEITQELDKIVVETWNYNSTTV